MAYIIQQSGCFPKVIYVGSNDTGMTLSKMSMDWFKGKFTGKPHKLMGKSMVSCIFSLKPIHSKCVFHPFQLDPLFEQNGRGLKENQNLCPTSLVFGISIPENSISYSLLHHLECS